VYLKNPYRIHFPNYVAWIFQLKMFRGVVEGKERNGEARNMLFTYFLILRRRRIRDRNY
jgi:hypothetical protein